MLNMDDSQGRELCGKRRGRHRKEMMIEADNRSSGVLKGSMRDEAGGVVSVPPRGYNSSRRGALPPFLWALYLFLTVADPHEPLSVVEQLQREDKVAPGIGVFFHPPYFRLFTSCTRTGSISTSQEFDYLYIYDTSPTIPR
ncbi:hypothetical protein FPV67DRAFT_1454817 [Lyophyllum atratum]|nr:hypothetical protein FPV67DRAFT_1454817 [Lyophyllum atratum]